jgi:hypothetical protein
MLLTYRLPSADRNMTRGSVRMVGSLQMPATNVPTTCRIDGGTVPVAATTPQPARNQQATGSTMALSPLFSASMTDLSDRGQCATPRMRIASNVRFTGVYRDSSRFIPIDP